MDNMIAENVCVLGLADNWHNMIQEKKRSSVMSFGQRTLAALIQEMNEKPNLELSP